MKKLTLLLISFIIISNSSAQFNRHRLGFQYGIGKYNHYWESPGTRMTTLYDGMNVDYYDLRYDLMGKRGKFIQVIYGFGIGYYGYTRRSMWNRDYDYHKKGDLFVQDYSTYTLGIGFGLKMNVADWKKNSINFILRSDVDIPFFTKQSTSLIRDNEIYEQRDNKGGFLGPMVGLGLNYTKTINDNTAVYIEPSVEGSIDYNSMWGYSLTTGVSFKKFRH